MNVINSFLTAVGDWTFRALSPFSPFVVMVILSAVTGILLLLAYRYTSNQQAIKRARNGISAHLLSMRLFKDEIGVAFRAQGRLLAGAGQIILLSLKPLLIMTIPMVFFLVQLALRYEHRPLSPSESAIVTAFVKPDAASGVNAAAEAAGGIRVDTPVVRVRRSADSSDPRQPDELYWRISVDRPDTTRGQIRLILGEQHVEMPVIVGDGLVRVDERRPGFGFFDRVLHPSLTPASEESGVLSVDVGYPKRALPVLGYEPHWIITYLALSTLFALLAKPFLRVHI